MFDTHNIDRKTAKNILLSLLNAVRRWPDGYQHLKNICLPDRATNVPFIGKICPYQKYLIDII